MRIIVCTNDGSDTVYDDQCDAHFHSLHGALTESKHVFMQNGLDRLSSHLKNIDVLEIGFGTGLNAYLSAGWAHQKEGKTIRYVAIENQPLPKELWEQLNYPSLIELPQDSIHFADLHLCAWNESIALSSHFYLHKSLVNALQWESDMDFDIVFMDAFAPSTQPELWTEYMLHRLHQRMKFGGLISSYCAKGSYRRMLKSTGFGVEILPGPPGKREMTLAVKK